MLYIGVDLGTSACKFLLMDEVGEIKNIVTKQYPVFYPKDGWSEQNPQDWYAAAMDGIAELVADFDRSQVAGIGVGGQMHGLVALDGEDNVIRPAILWNDGRTEEEVTYLNEVIGRDVLSDNTANIAFAGFTAPKLLWMKKHEPENFEKISKICLPKDYLVYMLTGVHSTDYSDASGMLLLDVKNKCWSKKMMEICDVKEEQLPRLFESYEVVGTLKQELAESLGLSKDVKVVAGAGDNAAAAIGTATVGSGKCNISLGTSGTIFISSDNFGLDPNNALHAFAHADGKYHLMGCMLSAASCNNWWMQDILGTDEFELEQSKIDAEKLGKNNVFFLPYLMGERSPINDVNARGTFIGLTAATTRADMLLAVMEGVAFAVRDSLEVARSLDIKPLQSNICGGGAKSALWKKILCNVLNIRLDTVKTEQGPGYGGAILAAVGCGEFSSVEQAISKLVEVSDSISPENELATLYEAQYNKYKQIYPALKSVFKNLR